MECNKIELSTQLKNGVIQLMDNMRGFCKSHPQFDFPEVSDKFKLTREVLEKGEFNLAVCGKVKNGKSSLINALIGKELLPVCNDVATSRVFKISHAEEEKFYLVFANGNLKEICQNELKDYGSQAEINKKGEQDIENTIAYIQVFTPISFLPKGVSLIDTPGIGSMYPQHTAITKRFINMADAALFVMNPTPLEAIETNFLKEIVSVTPGILFVTTKIDQNGNDSVEESMKRNYKIIDDAIGENLPFGIKMQKMSSTLLLAASNSEDEIMSNFNYEISGYDNLKTSINDLVFSMLGYYRVGTAYNACVEYYKDVLKSLKLRRTTVEQATSDYERLAKQYNDSKREFQESIGEEMRKKLLFDIETILKTMEADFDQMFSTNGIIGKYIKEIEGLTQEELVSYNEKLPNRIITDIQDGWEKLTSLVISRVDALLENYNKECSMIIPNEGLSISQEGLEESNIKEVNMRDKFLKARNEMFMGTTITMAMSAVCQGLGYFVPALALPLTPVLTPVFVLLGIGSVLWGVISGNQKANQETLSKNKSQLLQYVTDTAAYCRNQITSVSLADGKYESLYQGFIQSIRIQVNNSTTNIYMKYYNELETMKKALVEAQQNPKLLIELDQIIREWSRSQVILHNIHAELETIKPV